MTRSPLSSLKNFLARPPLSRRYAWRNFMQRRIGTATPWVGGAVQGVFLSNLPDSYWLVGEHVEFGELYRRFVMYNAVNNGNDVARLWAFMLNIKQVIKESIEGDFAELGVWRGNTAALLAHYAKTSGRSVFLFDTFEGFAPRDLISVDANKAMAFADTSVALVRDVIGPNANVCHFIEGYFPESVTAQSSDRQYAVVSLDCDLYEPMRAGLEFFYQRMPPGGIFLLHDYSSTTWDGAIKAIDEFCQRNREFVVLLPDKSGSAFIRVAHSAPTTRAGV
jgi:SAM-dependent methyltransferase